MKYFFPLFSLLLLLAAASACGVVRPVIQPTDSTRVEVRYETVTVHDTAYVDLYLPTDASQFGKTDAILIANLYRMYDEKNYRSDLTDFESMEWFSDKAWNSDDVCLFKYDNLKLVGINIFDGSYVLTFTGHIVSDGEYLAKKYETDELTAKYEERAPKGDTVGMFVNTKKDNKENKDEE